MPVCDGCGGSFDSEYKFCPYCGRSKPESPKLEVNVKVSEEAGRFTCPSCHRADKAQKVSGILASQTRLVEAQTANIHTIGSNTTLLVDRLSDIPKRPEPAKGAVGCLIEGYGMIIMAVLGFLVYLFVLFSGDADGEDVPLVLGFLFTGFLGYVALATAKSRRAKAKQVVDDTVRWNQAMQKHSELIYCGRCDCVFLPEKGSFAPIQKMKEYLYSA